MTCSRRKTSQACREALLTRAHSESLSNELLLYCWMPQDGFMVLGFGAPWIPQIDLMCLPYLTNPFSSAKVSINSIVAGS